MKSIKSIKWCKTSSSNCANCALWQCAKDYGEAWSHSHRAVEFFVENCLKSVATEDQALRHTQDLTSLSAKRGFKLDKWVSNSWVVIVSIPLVKRAMEIKDLDLRHDILPVERALGIQWCMK